MVMVFVKNLSDSDLPETSWEDRPEVVCTVTRQHSEKWSEGMHKWHDTNKVYYDSNYFYVT